MGYDQTAKTDEGKEDLTLVPTKIIHAIAKVRAFGSKKYRDPDNWKKVEAERYRKALLRHIMAWWEDPRGVDYESGLPHLYHAATNIAFLLELEGDPMTCDRCPTKALNPYWCSWHDRECKYYREVTNGNNTESGRVEQEVARIQSEEHRRMS